MAMNFNSRDMVDVVLEITAMKSKLLLTDGNLLSLSQRHEGLRDLAEYIKMPSRWVRIYPEEFEDYVLSLRKAVGNLSDDEDSTTVMVKRTKALFASGQDVETAQRVVEQLIRQRDVNNLSLIHELCTKENVAPTTVIELLLMYAEMQNRWSFTYMFQNVQTRDDWDGVRSLDDLFQTEIVPHNQLVYFDQEFINYLSENNDDIHAIHWRNFERIVGEFFNKIGYTVELGPGRADGGVDLRIYNDQHTEKGPPLIIVQCKRYKKGNLVDVNTVKAFYADVLHEEARIGLIATTSMIEPAGKKVIHARGYNVATAESREVAKMINGMWRTHFRG